MSGEPRVGVEALKARAEVPAREAMRLHPFYRGKIETGLKCRVRDFDDFAIWYSPGVAAPCKAIAADPETVYDHTNKWNTVAVVSDGTRVLGLGDIGPKAGLPVMEGKALLFKYLGGVDAFPLMLDTKDPQRIIEFVLAAQPSFGGINLEDIAQPKCFEILDALREKAEIPVWHDDQQGTATVILAGLINALKVVGKRIGDVGIAFVGAGASNSAAARLIFGRGGDPGRCMIVDSRGILGAHRTDVEAVKDRFAAKWNLCRTTNAEGRRGGIEEALRGMDVVIGCSTPGPGTIKPEWVRAMKPGAIVFACANPIPEIWPWEAAEAGVTVFATGRSDFPNQVNNSLCFPGLFRGALDVRARTITDEMCFAAAESLASSAGSDIRADRILPTMDDWEVFPREAADVGVRAQELGLARTKRSWQDLFDHASRMIRRSRGMTAEAMRRGDIPAAPEA
ncbi:MAG: NADP-dependent malic enzyme [Lentisphaerae bacterium]|nr:NADP-dependent malic enzyme [Lentisphaerota bacterium]